MIPVTYPSSVSTSKESQMVVYSLSSVAGLQRWTDYIPVKYQSTGSDVPNSFNTNGYIACDFITNLTGKQAWVDYIPVFVDNLATTAWQVSDTGFIPFNTLAGGGTYVSLDLNFLNTTTLDSRITFSRGTNATLTDSNGRIAWAPHNLLTNSEDFEASVWTKTSATIASNNAVAPDGTTTADTFTAAAANAVIGQAWTSTTAPYTFSIWIRRVSGSGVIEINGGASWTTASVTTDWQRISVTQNITAGVPSVGLRIVTSGDVIQVWGAQLNVGSTAQSYNSTTPKNLLGFTQEPENAAWTKSNSYVQQNLLTWSQDFDNAAWIKSPAGVGAAPVVTANQAIAPDGTTTADLVVLANTGTTTSDWSWLYQNFSAAATTTYTYSVWVKASAPSEIGKGIVIAGSAANSLVTLTADWQRVTQTSTTVGAGTISVGPRLRGVETTATTASFFIWGAQLVQGSTAGDYTQTTSAAAPTRYLNWDGTLTGRKLVSNTAAAVPHGIQQNATTSQPVMFSFYAKAAEYAFAVVASSANNYVYYDLTNGVVFSTAGTGWSSPAITAVGGGWYRCSALTSTANTRFDIFMSNVGQANGNTAPSFTGDGTSGIYVSDFQLSNSASVDPYVYNPQAAAASAAFYGPRFDYNPTTLAANGLLIEEQRTNLLTYSEQFDNAAWVKTNSTVTANATTAPDGTVAADKLVEDTATSTHQAYQNFVGTVAPYTFSVYAKAGERTVVTLLHGSGNSADYDLVAATATGSGASIAPVGNGWYRCIITQTLPDTANRSYAVRLNNGSGVTYTGNGTSGAFIWGAQLEAGSFATSYIPTVASQVTRNADSASMLGDNFYTWYNVNQGSWSSEFATTNTGNAWVFAVTTSAGQHDLVKGPTTVNYRYGNGVNSDNVLTITLGSAIGKFAGAYTLNGTHAAAINGSAVTTTGVSAAPTETGSLRLGTASGGTTPLNGTIRRISYYNTRLPDSTLQAMTT